MQFIREKFFKEYRKHFRAPSQNAVDGIEFLLFNFEADGWTDIRLISYCLATCKHETADTYQPIKEYRARASSKGRANQDRYWLSGYYGRGLVQITWLKNYKKLGEAVGADLVAKPDLALVPNIAFEILVVGMLRGLFTGKKLSDYINGSTCDYKRARRIVNGMDCADLIAGHAESFEQILKNSISTDSPEAGETKTAGPSGT